MHVRARVAWLLCARPSMPYLRVRAVGTSSRLPLVVDGQSLTHRIPEALHGNAALTELNLSSNNIGAEGAAKLGEAPIPRGPARGPREPGWPRGEETRLRCVRLLAVVYPLLVKGVVAIVVLLVIGPALGARGANSHPETRPGPWALGVPEAREERGSCRGCQVML